MIEEGGCREVTCCSVEDERGDLDAAGTDGEDEDRADELCLECADV